MAQLNFIGGQRVRQIFGQPPGRPTQTVERIDIRGTDGTILRKLGFRSQNFTIETVIDQLTGEQCRLAYYMYTTFIGAPPAKFIWNGYDYDQENIRFSVLETELIYIKRNVLICGGLTGGQWDIRARWTGLLVPTN